MRTTHAAYGLALLVASLTTAMNPASAQTPPAGAGVPEVTVGTVVFLGNAGGLAPDPVAELLRGRVAALRGCYVPALATTPTLSGEIQVDVTYHRNGRAATVTTVGMATAPTVGQCVTRTVQALHFPRPTERGVTEVRFLATVQFHRAAPGSTGASPGGAAATGEATP